MKLRGRFTLTLALAALVPIVVAAVVTRQVIASSKRADYESERVNAQPGQQIRVTPDPNLVHLFNEQTGKRL